MPTDDSRKDEVSPAEFVRRMPEGQSAGPGAPETDEPVQGRPGAGGHGPDDGPGGPAMQGMGDDRSEDVEGDFPDGSGEDRGGTGAGTIKEGVAEAGREARDAFKDRGAG